MNEEIMSDGIIIGDLSALPPAARRFVEAMGSRTVFAFYGKMGVGKTTFIKAICEALGVTGVINSPSFSIVNEYCTPAGAPVYHFDFYRIKDLAEACDTGCEDYFYSGAYCFVEWPEKAAELLPPDTATVQIAENDGKRIVTVVNPQRKR